MRKTLCALFTVSTVIGVGLGCGSGGGEKGDKGEPGAPGSSTSTEAAISNLMPDTLFAGRTVVVQISGSETNFDDGTTVDFGDPAIKVVSVQRRSSANLSVLLEVGVDAKMGPHDVMVMSPQPPTGGDEEHLVLRAGFTVLPSLIAELPAGAMTPSQVPQGGIVEITMRSIDELTNPFNPMAGQGPTLAFGPLSLDTPQVSALRYGYLGLVDALAPATGLSLGVTQPDRLGQVLGYASSPGDKNAPQITARPATLLAQGTAKVGELLWPVSSGTRATNLYKLTTAADNQVVHLSFSALGSALSTSTSTPRGISLVGQLAPSSGQFRERVNIQTSETPGAAPDSVAMRNALLLLPKAGDYYFAIYASDLSNSTNHGYTLTARWATAANIGSLDEKPPNTPDSPTMPRGNIANLDKPYFATDGMADDRYEEDFIRFKAAKTGRVYVSVRTTPNLTMGLGMRAADCTSAILPTRYTVQGVVANEFDAIQGTAYCVRVVGNGVSAPYEILISQSLN